MDREPSQLEAFPRYQCPGDSNEISRSVHLGRLASFYPACRECACRFDQGLLPPSQQQQLEALFESAPAGTLLFEEGLVGIAPTDIHPASVRRAATAFAQLLEARGDLATRRGPVLLGCDGRPATYELLAAAAAGLRMENIDVLEVGPATAGSFAQGLQTVSAQGGLLLGAARGQRREISLKFWGPAGAPFSLGPELTNLEACMKANPPRGSRAGGSLGRIVVEGEYLARLAPWFHALRPLTVYVDCQSETFWRYLHLLSDSVACRFVNSREKAGDASDGFDLRVWIDGDGEALRVWDERGVAIAEPQLLLLLASRLLRDHPSAVIVVPGDWPARWRKAIRKSAPRASVSVAGDTRWEFHRALLEADASFGGGARGRYYLAEPGPLPSPTADALPALALLLNILSESDTPLSQRLSADF